MSRRFLHGLHSGEQGDDESKDFQEFHGISKTRVVMKAESLRILKTFIPIRPRNRCGRRVRVVAFAFAVAEFRVAIMRTAMLPR